MNRGDRGKRLGEIASIASALRTDAAWQGGVPDLTSSILSRVDSQRPFLDRATRRAIWFGRIGLGASVAVVVLGACLAWRMWPEKMDLSHEPAPLSAVVDSVGTNASTRLINLRESIGSVKEGDAGRMISAMAVRIEPAISGVVVVGPMMPTIEAVSRGIGVQPACLRATGNFGTVGWVGTRTLLTSSKYATAMPLKSTLLPACQRDQSGMLMCPAMLTVETSVRPGVLIDEHELDSGFGPK